MQIQVELEKCMNSSMVMDYGKKGKEAYTKTVDDMQKNVSLY